MGVVADGIPVQDIEIVGECDIEAGQGLGVELVKDPASGRHKPDAAVVENFDRAQNHVAIVARIDVRPRKQDIRPFRAGRQRGALEIARARRGAGDVSRIEHRDKRFHSLLIDSAHQEFLVAVAVEVREGEVGDAPALPESYPTIAIRPLGRWRSRPRGRAISPAGRPRLIEVRISDILGPALSP